MSACGGLCWDLGRKHECTLTKEHFKGVSVKQVLSARIFARSAQSIFLPCAACSGLWVLGGDAEAAEGRAGVNSEPACAQVFFLPCVYVLGCVIKCLPKCTSTLGVLELGSRQTPRWEVGSECTGVCPWPE